MKRIPTYKKKEFTNHQIPHSKPKRVRHQTILESKEEKIINIKFNSLSILSIAILLFNVEASTLIMLLLTMLILLSGFSIEEKN